MFRKGPGGQVSGHTPGVSGPSLVVSGLDLGPLEAKDYSRSRGVGFVDLENFRKITDLRFSIWYVILSLII